MNVPKLRFKEFDGEWEENLLKDITEINPKSEALDEKFEYIDLEAVSKGLLINSKVIDKFQAPSRAQRVVSKNDILYQTVRPYQKNNLFINFENKNLQMVASTGYAQIRTDNKIDAKWLYQAINTSKFTHNVLLKCTGTSYPAINSSDLGEIEMKFPELKEQKKIGLLFEIIDKKIQLQQQKIDLLQEQKKGYMQKIFDNNKSDTSGEKWERINLNEIFLIIDGDRGKNYPSEEEFLEHGHTLFLDTKNVTKKGFKFNTKKFISEEKCKKMNNGLLMRNDLVLTSRGTIGNLALYDDSVPFNSVRINSAMLILRLVKPDISLMFLYHLLKSKVLIDFIRSSSVGSAQPHITKKDLKSLKVTFPSSLVSQEKIARFLSLIDESVKFEEEKLGLLLKQKQGFMQQMFI